VNVRPASVLEKIAPCPAPSAKVTALAMMVPFAAPECSSRMARG
jgi:hypothetical protein